MTRYNRDVVDASTEFAGAKGFFTILNGGLGCLFCILSGAVAVGIILAVLCVLVGLLYYVVRSGGEPDVGYGSTTVFGPVHPWPLIASWFISLAASLISAGSGGRLGTLWGWIAGAFAFALLLQFWFWKQTVGWAKKNAVSSREIKAFNELVDKIRYGEVKCAKCGNFIYDRYSIAMKDDRVAVLCSKCLEWKEGGATQVGDLYFVHMKL